VRQEGARAARPARGNRSSQWGEHNDLRGVCQRQKVKRDESGARWDESGARWDESAGYRVFVLLLPEPSEPPEKSAGLCPFVGSRLEDVRDASGNLVSTHKGRIEKRAEMIAREGKSPIELAWLFNEQKVGGRQTLQRSRSAGQRSTAPRRHIAPISIRRCSSARSVAAAGRR